MASKFASDFSCPVCFEVFTDPVFLSCSHSFCKDCLQKFWEQNENLLCPVCRRRSSKSDPPRNLVLKNLCEVFLQERGQRASAVSETEALCGLHKEKIKLFCLEDKQPVCLVCRDSKRHINHSFRPIDEAALDFKEELQPKLQPLEEKLKNLQKAKQSREEWSHHIKNQAQRVQQEIRKEFERLHDFLRDEEAIRIVALIEEEEEKSQKMKMQIEELDKSISYLTSSIKTIKTELNRDDTAFLQNYAMTAKRTQCNLKDPEIPSGALIDVSKHLGNLKFKVWEKMQSIAQYMPVILDPNTAPPTAVVSEDLTSMRFSDFAQVLPSNPERFDYYECILGSDGINSGIHIWDVEVKNNTQWYVGVLRESVQRKGEPLVETGFWDLGYYAGQFIVDNSGVKNQLSLKNRELERIRVHLDWNKGKLTFSDPLTDTQLHCLRISFNERVFPYFWTKSTVNPIRILPMKTSVIVERS
ncbi:tripartite motif-containing protein 35-like [Pygocentrus nattereri]|uniref:Zinc-binding protein A33-like n=1 Tax=Pygocentrus nattereri TaxID=42514 RepID=A0A3B4D320_PYGNA|nr:tripartite motif-containing protein 35-like [Pygocentrus nattereri]